MSFLGKGKQKAKIVANPEVLNANDLEVGQTYLYKNGPKHVEVRYSGLQNGKHKFNGLCTNTYFVKEEDLASTVTFI